ncbi:hypothetical protein BD413DRAFT_496210 [Trametes elegans]|nr:hypothetical protein BD413DRAFT_496210 [Trametes elegans]
MATEEVVEVVTDTALRAIYCSRAEPKLAARKRKAKGTEWDTPKYACALSINATSDDEDNPALVPGEALKFHQHMLTTLDARPDPDPDAAKKQTTRMHGAVKEGVKLAHARQLKNMHRIWMIKPEALEQNPHWLTSGCVAANGRAWGDVEDPAELPVKEKGKGGTLLKFRRLEETADIAAACARVAELTNGQDVDKLFGSM